VIRRLAPVVVLPLALLAGGLASSPWLRAFPSDVIAAPLIGAALLSVLVPFVVLRLGERRLWLTALIYLAAVRLLAPPTANVMCGAAARGMVDHQRPRIARPSYAAYPTKAHSPAATTVARPGRCASVAT